VIGDVRQPEHGLNAVITAHNAKGHGKGPPVHLPAKLGMYSTGDRVRLRGGVARLGANAMPSHSAIAITGENSSDSWVRRES
jgi:hypothetical protein